MKDILTEYNEEDNLIILHDEAGNDIKFEFLDLIEFENAEYVVFLPVDNAEDGEVLILKLEESDDKDMESYVSIDDDRVLNAVFSIFKGKYKDEYNFVDDNENIESNKNNLDMEKLLNEEIEKILRDKTLSPIYSEYKRSAHLYYSCKSNINMFNYKDVIKAADKTINFFFDKQVEKLIYDYEKLKNKLKSENEELKNIADKLKDESCIKAKKLEELKDIVDKLNQKYQLSLIEKEKLEECLEYKEQENKEMKIEKDILERECDKLKKTIEKLIVNVDEEYQIRKKYESLLNKIKITTFYEITEDEIYK